jgi:hypothetical protein
MVSIDDDRFERIVHLLSPAPRSGVAAAIAELLAVDESSLPLVLQDVGDEIAFTIGIDSALRARLIDASRRPAVRRAAPRAAAGRVDLAAARRRLAAKSSRRLGRVVRG